MNSRIVRISILHQEASQIESLVNGSITGNRHVINSRLQGSSVRSAIGTRNSRNFRQLVVAGSRGTADIVPLENECRMSWADTSFAVSPYKDQKRYIPVKDLPPNCRYDGMMQDFHAYITGKKTNPFTYAHDRLVQEVLDEIVGGVRFYGHDIGQ